MPNKSQVILSHQSYSPANPVTEYYAEPVPGDGYYGKSDGLHTIQYSLDGFIGKFIIQATVVARPTDMDWVTVVSNTHTAIEPVSSVIENFVGNYTWVRAGIIEWQSGTVNVCRMNN